MTEKKKHMNPSIARHGGHSNSGSFNGLNLPSPTGTRYHETIDLNEFENPIHRLSSLARIIKAANKLSNSIRIRRKYGMNTQRRNYLSDPNEHQINSMVYISRVTMASVEKELQQNQQQQTRISSAPIPTTQNPVSSSAVNVSPQMGGYQPNTARDASVNAAMNVKTRWKSAYTKASHATENLTGANSHSTNRPASTSGGSNNLGGHSSGATGGAGHAGSVGIMSPSKHPKQTRAAIFGDSLAQSIDLVPDTSLDNLEARISCAKSIYKLSSQPGSETSIIYGGAISQVADFSDVENLKLQEYCAAILTNLTSNEETLPLFVQKDGISALLEMCWSSSIEVKTLCATALCRLSLYPTFASSLSKSRAIIELLSMLTIPHDELQKYTVSCILNMIYHGDVFPERIFIGEPHDVQNRLGMMAVVAQLGNNPQEAKFAAMVLFNLSLYRSSAVGALRGGAAEILYALATTICKPLVPMGYTTILEMNKIICETLGNFSGYTDFGSFFNSFGIKTLMLLLTNAIKEFTNGIPVPVLSAISPQIKSEQSHTQNNKNSIDPMLILLLQFAQSKRLQPHSGEEKIYQIALSCSRVLANCSANEDTRKNFFHEDLMLLAAHMFSLEYHLIPTSPACFFKNSLKILSNLSFHETNATFFMKILSHLLQLLPLLTSVACYQSSSATTTLDDSLGIINHQNLFECRDQYHEEDEKILLEGLVDEEAKEDALVAISNLARHGKYHDDLLKLVDGKCLAHAADIEPNRRLKYIYALALCQLMFDNRLRKLVFGDWVVNALIEGFHYTEKELESMGLLENNNNVASKEDKERFLAAICIVCSELKDDKNIDRVVGLALQCLQQQPQQQQHHHHHHPPHSRKSQQQQHEQQQDQETQSSSLPSTIKNALNANTTKALETFAAAAMYVLAREMKTTKGSKIYSKALESALISVCRRSGTSNTTNAFCAATLYHLCASGNTNVQMIQALVDVCNAKEELQSLLACAAAFAMISFTSEGREMLLQAENLAKALNKLGRASQVEIQQYAAIATCNVATLKCIWSSSELKDFIVVALLRANSTQAKQIHAKTLNNLLSHPKTRSKLVEEGVLYALMKLSQTQATDNPEDFEQLVSLGLQALFNLSCEQKYHNKLISNGVIPYLSAAIAGKKLPKDRAELVAEFTASMTPPSSAASISSHRPSSPNRTSRFGFHNMSIPLSLESRRYAVGIICNLSSYEENHKELMNGQVTDVLRKYCDNDMETRASAAMALLNLSCKQPWVEMLCERKILSLLIQFSRSESKVVKRFSILTLANCSLVTDSLHLFAELKVIRAVLNVLEAMPDMESCMAALQLIHNIAFDDTLAMNLMEENAIVRLFTLVKTKKLGENCHACSVAICMASVLASKAKCAEALLKQKIVSFCALMHEKHPEDMAISYECICILMKMSTYQQIQLSLTETEVIQVIMSICTKNRSSEIKKDLTGGIILHQQAIQEASAVTIRNLTLCVAEHLSIFYEDDSSTLQEQEVFSSSSSSSSNKKINSNSGNTLDTIMDDDESSKEEETQQTIPPSSSQLMIVHKNLFEGFKLLQEQVLLTLNLEEKNTHTERMLIEISTAFANLSTIKSLRRTMVQHGTISTLLSMYQVGIKQVQNICATTLHRLSLETEAKVEQGLIQSLLSILQESDVALHHVRYECEKISLITSRPFPLNHQIGASTCIKQNYRDPKWILFALETTLSCHPMVPELEQKSIKTIGVPRISFLDRNQKISNLTCTKKGYLLYVDMEKKFVRSGGQILDDKIHTTKTTGSIKHENDVAFQSKKFDRHMRITRRNYRKNPTFLPVISLV